MDCQWAHCAPHCERRRLNADTVVLHTVQKRGEPFWEKVLNPFCPVILYKHNCDLQRNLIFPLSTQSLASKRRTRVLAYSPPARKSTSWSLASPKKSVTASKRPDIIAALKFAIQFFFGQGKKGKRDCEIHSNPKLTWQRAKRSSFFPSISQTEWTGRTIDFCQGSRMHST